MEIIRFRATTEGFGQPVLFSDYDTEILDEVLYKIYEIQPELSDFGVYLNYGSLEFDINDDNIEVSEDVWDLLSEIECVVV